MLIRILGRYWSLTGLLAQLVHQLNLERPYTSFSIALVVDTGDIGRTGGRVPLLVAPSIIPATEATGVHCRWLESTKGHRLGKSGDGRPVGGAVRRRCGREKEGRIELSWFG